MDARGKSFHGSNPENFCPASYDRRTGNRGVFLLPLPISFIYFYLIHLFCIRLSSVWKREARKIKSVTGRAKRGYLSPFRGGIGIPGTRQGRAGRTRWSSRKGQKSYKRTNRQTGKLDEQKMLLTSEHWSWYEMEWNENGVGWRWR